MIRKEEGWKRRPFGTGYWNMDCKYKTGVIKKGKMIGGLFGSVVFICEGFGMKVLDDDSSRVI